MPLPSRQTTTIAQHNLKYAYAHSVVVKNLPLLFLPEDHTTVEQFTHP